MPRRKKSWSKSFGPYGARIRIFEDPVSGIYYGESADATLKSGRRCRSLRHRDRARAERWAIKQAAKLQAGEEAEVERVPTSELAVTLYLRYQSPKKCESEQRADVRRAELFRRVLGADKDLRRLTRFEWDTFIDLRGSGAIDARGRPVEEAKRRPVRAGTVKGDLVFLRAVLRWATRWQDRAGRYLLPSDPSRGFDFPRDLNPRRPVAGQERFERVAAAAHKVMMRVEWGEKRVSRPSYLPQLLVLAHGTGRRISSICALRYADLRLDREPYPAIHWRAESDKTNRESLVPVSPEVEKVLRSIVRERPGIGSAPIFPAPTDRSKPISTAVAAAWLRKAEKMVGLEPHDGSLWHAYRRGWATARKGLSDIDVAHAGGWSDTRTLKAVYQQPDERSMYHVVSSPRQIKEA